jgi:hypothetical protein
MSLTPDTDGADANDPAAAWRFAVACVATRRTLAVATAFAAALGLLPLYESVWWWDILTHTLAGAAIAGWLLLSRLRLAWVVVVLAALSGAWEVAEFATPNYVFVAGGPADTAVDVVCNFLGAGVVATGFGLVRTADEPAGGDAAHRVRRRDSARPPTDD